MADRTITTKLSVKDDASKNFDKAGKSAGKMGTKIKNAGKGMTSFGKNASIFATAPIVAMATSSIKAFTKQEQALANVEAGLESTGNAIGYTLEELGLKAQALQQKGIYGDEEVLQSVTAQLLTFGNIGKQSFDRAQQASVDLAAKLGDKGDLHSATIMLSKALNDPIANLSAMSRAGVQFSDEQEDMAKALWEAGDQAGSQAIILQELEKYYGGANEAIAKTASGGLKQFGNEMGDVNEKIGEANLKILTALLPTIEKFADWISGLSEKQLLWITGILGLVAVIGPLSAIIGIATTAIGWMTSGVVALNAAMYANPIGLVILAIVALIAVVVLVIVHFDTLKRWVGNVFTWIKDKAIMPVINWLIGAWNSAFNFVKDKVFWVKDKISWVIDSLKNVFNRIRGFVEEPFKKAFNFISDGWNNTVGKLSWSIPSWVPVIGGNSISAPQLPRLYTGAENFAGGTALVGEHGPELVHLPRGSDVQSASATQVSENAGSSDQNITFNIYSNMDLEVASQQLAYMVARG